LPDPDGPITAGTFVRSEPVLTDAALCMNVHSFENDWRQPIEFRLALTGGP
jgi:hypothetical protein